MKIIHRNAANALFEKAHFLDERAHNSWRCLHLALSRRPQRHNRALRMYFIAKAIMELLADMDGTVYLCDDGDVFILFQGSHKPIFARLAGHFEEIPGDAPEEDGPFSLFDLGRDWDVFYALCQHKACELLPECLAAGATASAPALENIRV